MRMLGKTEPQASLPTSGKLATAGRLPLAYTAASRSIPRRTMEMLRQSYI
jgi:hypothetical protein